MLVGILPVLSVLWSTLSVPPVLAGYNLENSYIELPDTGGYITHSAAQSQAVEDRSLHRGWPVDLSSPGAGFPYTPTLFDIDGDGADEIFLTGGETFGLSGDGSFLPGWPTSEMLYMGYGTNDQMPGPSCGDMEGNGSVEILWSLRDWYAGSAHYWTFNGRNSDGTDLAGLPMTAPDEPSNALDYAFVLGDSDGDGKLEAWTAHTLGNTGTYYRISGMDNLGNLSFTADLDTAETVQNLFFGDADGNGSDEFFAVTLLDGEFRLHLFTSAGTEQPGYPVGLFAPGGGYLMFGPVMAADLDGDGDLEFIMGHYQSSISYASAYHHDGTVVAGFPITVATTSQLFYLGLGDVTADGYPELIVTDNHLGSGFRIYAIDIPTGSPLSGWPVALTNWPEGSPTVVDVNSDGTQDICFTTNGGELFALSNDGTVINGYPKMMSASSISGVAAGDIDGDGYYELVAATHNGFVYAWDTDGVITSNNADWPMCGIDPRNTNVYYSSPTGGIEDEPQPLSLTISSNPVKGSAVFEVTGSTNSTVAIYDITGKLISEISSRNNQISWTPGSNVTSGVYFAKLSGEPLNPLKFIVIR